jgi:hypothetical protein
MTLTKSLLLLSTVSFLSGCIVVANPSHANHHSQKELSIDASSLTEFDIEAGAGSLTIIGSDDISEITVVADIYTESGHTDNYELELDHAGSRAYLVAKTKSSSGFWIGDSPHIDVKITVPSQLSLDVNDGSGATFISNITGSVEVDDGSGDLTFQNIKNKLTVNDGSGGLYIKDVIGNVSIEDGSGEIEINGVNGDVDIDDGSGSIVAKDITGSAIFEDGSGDLTVKKVDGLITIDDGSGDIDVEDAGGLKILESGSGGLRVHKVKGGFEIDS